MDRYKKKEKIYIEIDSAYIPFGIDKEYNQYYLPIEFKVDDIYCMMFIVIDTYGDSSSRH